MEYFSLQRYKELLQEHGFLIDADLFDMAHETVRGLCYNSRDVEEGTLFVCKGRAFKEEYLREAKELGALAYVSECVHEGVGLPHLIVNDIRPVMPVIADAYFCSPQNKLTLIGVGGTKGKTTTAFYIKAIFDAMLAAQSLPACGILSSICSFDGRTEKTSQNTTPEAIELYRHLANSVDNGVSYMVMEVTSQALKYHRVDGLHFDIGIFLNFSEDHISPAEHSDYEDYLSAKMKMFSQVDHAIVNFETAERDRVLLSAQEANDVILFSTEHSGVDYFAYNVQKTGQGSSFFVRGEKYEIPMPGLFNVDNALAAVAAASFCSIDIGFIQSGLQEAKVKGRMEIYRSLDENIIVVVDYAHNKLSFENLFSSLKSEFPEYRIIAVFGAVGDKAIQRRKELGQVAGAYADKVILTADEPGFEDVGDICQQIAVHVKKENCPFLIIEDRTEAVAEAFNHIQGKTLIVLAGKGHETRMKIKDRYIERPADAELASKYLHEYDELHHG